MDFFARLTTLLFALAVSACVSFPDAPQSTVSPAMLDASIRVSDGAELPYTFWPASRSKAVILALHGMNDYANAFALIGEWLADNQSITTYALDQRGFGRGPDAGIWPGAPTLKSDLRAAITAIRDRHPQTPLFVLGHSMGAAVVIAAAADEPLGVDGLILAAPGVWGGSALPWTHRLSANVAASFAPGKTLTGERAARQATDNIEVLRAMIADPLLIKHTRIKSVLGVVRLMGEAFEQADNVCDDSLVLIGLKDEIIPISAMEHVSENLCGEVDMRRYPEGWHLLMRDLQRERVWRDIAGWIDYRIELKRSEID